MLYNRKIKTANGFRDYTKKNFAVKSSDKVNEWPLRQTSLLDGHATDREIENLEYVRNNKENWISMMKSYNKVFSYNFRILYNSSNSLIIYLVAFDKAIS